MPSIPPATFASRLRSLSDGEFVAFVADLWAASGWETAAEQPVVRTRRGDTERRLLVLPPQWLPRLRTAPDPGGTVDAVVTPRRSAGSLPRATPDAEVITADDLHDRLCYGVPAGDGEQLAREAFGVPLRDGRWAEDDSLLAALGGESGDEDGTAGPVTRRTALGVLGAGAVGVGGALVGRRLASGGADGPAQFDGAADVDDTVSTPSESDGAGGDGSDGKEPSMDQLDVTFAFAYDDGRLTITHDGGSPVPAGELLVRGEGLRIGPEYRWSHERRYDVDEPITGGDELSLSVDDDYDIAVIWDGDGDREPTLAGDTGPYA